MFTKQIGARRRRHEMSILVVDDEAFIRYMARTVLEGLGFCVLTAEDARQGLAILQDRADEVALVLLGLQVPALDGADALRELLHGRPSVRVILSGGACCPDPELLGNFGAGCSVLPKPYLPSALVHCVMVSLGQ